MTRPDPDHGDRSYPLRAAVTRRFSLGVPRGVTVVGPPSARKVVFLRSDAGDDPVTHLWSLDLVTGETLRLVDARTLGEDDADLPSEERARRERVREQAGGITSYSVDAAGSSVVFALAGRLHVVDLETGRRRPVDVDLAVFDPQLSPDGRRIAVHHQDGVSLVSLDDPGAPPQRLIEETGVIWGRAEFIAAEEMTRLRGMWWSPDSTRLAICRVDESAVRSARITDPSRPESEPTVLRYPFAGTANARVGLAILDVATGERRDVALDVDGSDEYLARVRWDVDPLLVATQPRDQRELHVRSVDVTSGATSTARRVTGSPWVELLTGMPLWLDGLLTVEDVADDAGALRRALCRDGVALTPAGVEVRDVLSVHRGPDGRSGILLLTVSLADPMSQHVLPVRISPDGVEVEDVLDEAPGLHHVAAAMDAVGLLDVLVRRVSDLSADAPRIVVEHVGRAQHPIVVLAEVPSVVARPRMVELGARRLRAALLLPSDAQGDEPLPVVLDPYGGPHAQRVVAARAAYHGAQWLADQGFAVLIVDGRGTPGRGPAFEHAVHHDLAGPALEDQLDALDAAALVEPRLDLTRVGIRGWSYGGTLAALAALRRPDRIRAAVVGAPVTDWHLYDTHYTERYLGHPDAEPAAYERSGVVDAAGRLVGPDPEGVDAPPAQMLIVHGLADDNVLAAHSLRLTEALLAAGRPYRFVPLTSATHMASDPMVAARLLTMQALFLAEALVAQR